MTGLRALAPFARAARSRSLPARCELCGAVIGEEHAHVLAVEHMALACSCGACAVLFRDVGAGGGRYRTVPDRVLVDEGAPVDDATWSALGIPVRLAFVVRRAGTWTALYPSPGGPVEAELSDEAQRVLTDTLPLAAQVEPEVEALLMHRPRGGAADCMVVPIDACFALCASVRRSWRGFSGGDEVEGAITDFLGRLRARGEHLARPRARGDKR